MKIVYTCFTTDVIHEGHLNIIHEALKYGEVIVGVLSDEAMIRYNQFPTIPFEKRMELIRTLPGVSRVVIQKDVMYDEIVNTYRPDYIVHGITGITVRLRQFVQMLKVCSRTMAVRLSMCLTLTTKM